MLSVRLPEEVEARLERLAKETGRTRSFCARAAIVEKIEDMEDMEDMYLAERVLERVRKAEQRILDADGIWTARTRSQRGERHCPAQARRHPAGALRA